MTRETRRLRSIDFRERLEQAAKVTFRVKGFISNDIIDYLKQ